MEETMGAAQKLKTGSLLEKLSIFGLNPQEWDFADNGEGFFSTLLIINKKDPQFRLIGHVNPKGWQKIEVLSL